jgi:hypothetical protein
MENQLKSIATSTVTTVNYLDKVTAKMFSYGSVNNSDGKGIETKLNEKEKTNTFSWQGIDGKYICKVPQSVSSDNALFGTIGRFLVESQVIKNKQLLTFGNTPVRHVLDVATFLGVPLSFLNENIINSFIEDLKEFSSNENATIEDTYKLLSYFEENYQLCVTPDNIYAVAIMGLTSISKNLSYFKEKTYTINAVKELSDGTKTLNLSIKFETQKNKSDNLVSIAIIESDTKNRIKASEELKSLFVASDNKELFIVQEMIKSINQYKKDGTTSISLELKDKSESKGIDFADMLD